MDKKTMALEAATQPQEIAPAPHLPEISPPPAHDELPDNIYYLEEARQKVAEEERKKMKEAVEKTSPDGRINLRVSPSLEKLNTECQYWLRAENGKVKVHLRLINLPFRLINNHVIEGIEFDAESMDERGIVETLFEKIAEVLAQLTERQRAKYFETYPLNRVIDKSTPLPTSSKTVHLGKSYGNISGKVEVNAYDYDLRVLDDKSKTDLREIAKKVGEKAA